MLILGVETSCDETSAAVIENNTVLSNVISSQTVHLQFGGVVPELASRAHLRKVIPIVEEALTKAEKKLPQMDGFAVTYGPGLIGALLVGVNYVKGLATILQKPFVGINHIEGHVYSNFLGETDIQLPLLCLIVSGGHTQLVIIKEHLQYDLIGKTRDDAVGEAFDKVAKLLGLPYPGGPQIDKMSKKGNPEYTNFPMNFVNQLDEKGREDHLADICAAFQKAAIDALTEKTVQAAHTYQIRQIAVAGGVAANSYLRESMRQRAEEYHLKVYFPETIYCTDNAAMIARAGLERLRRDFRSALNLNAYPSLQLGEEKSQG
jgi:N6-L-threonylcarbamoyladenine synthase